MREREREIELFFSYFYLCTEQSFFYFKKKTPLLSLSPSLSVIIFMFIIHHPSSIPRHSSFINVWLSEQLIVNVYRNASSMYVVYVLRPTSTLGRGSVP